jgi:hypothetical protein
MGEVKCRQCSRDFVRRVSRAGIVDMLLSLFYLYPFKCQLCGDRFRARQTGVRSMRVEDDRREYDRMEMRFPISFSAAEASGDGVMLNFSMAGCNFSTSAQIPPGVVLRMVFHVKPGLVPISVEAALVRYVGPGSVGVEFLRLEASERERLQHLVRGKLIESPTALAVTRQ